MRRLLTTIGLLLCVTANAQYGKVIVGSLVRPDTNSFRAKAFFDSSVYLLGFTPDSTKALGIDANGKIYLKEVAQEIDTTSLSNRIDSKLDVAYLDSFYKRGGNTFGEASFIGLRDNYTLGIGTNDNNTLEFFTSGNVAIKKSGVDVGKQFVVEGDSRFYGTNDYYVDVGNSIQVYRESNGNRVYQLAANGDFSARLDLFNGSNNTVIQLSALGSFHNPSLAIGKSSTGAHTLTVGDNRFGVNGSTGYIEKYGNAIPANGHILRGTGTDFRSVNLTTDIVTSMYTVSGAGTLSLTATNGARYYVFNGTSTTWTLPTVASSTGGLYIIKNRGSGTITLNTNGGGNEIYDTSAANTISVTAGSYLILLNDGTFFNVINK